MLLKIVAVLIGIAIIAYLTFSFWASCDIKYQMCSTLCDIKHINSDFNKAGCKGGCFSKKIACISSESIEK
jgi:hypothetical protein